MPDNNPIPTTTGTEEESSKFLRARLREANTRTAELKTALDEAASTVESFSGLIGYGPDCDEKIARWEALLNRK